MAVKTVSIDTGNAFYKGVRAGRSTPTTVAFPNAWTRPKDGAMADWKGFGAKDQLLISLNGGEQLALGESAYALGRVQHERAGYARYDSPEYPGGEIALIFSLPVDGFGRAQEQIDRLRGDWQIAYYNGHVTSHLNFTVRPEQAVPEAFGSLCFYVLSVDGTKFIDLELAEGNVAIVDIGGYTTDVLTFHTLDLGPIYSSVERGIINVRDDINTAIKRQFQRSDLKAPALDKIVEARQYKHAGHTHDVGEIVNTALWDLTDGVLDIWINQLEEGVDYDAVIFTGGGAPIVAPKLLPHIHHANVKVVPKDFAHLANAIGAYRYALHVRAYA
jgi:hypothetical protein